ncbi:cell wall-binding repeat-containing protein [Herbiconiux flava]|uniref:Putative cell wall-binding protein n=1 Tax=Herbiconiux flava TaxID=881268 RepID=A0A852SNC5_9MICO|nr:cell wall-binding repeat-containing protein [Herbiconiux flava]NYD70296.1 putative cell wall-binding protein [Herbiconiux flava]
MVTLLTGAALSLGLTGALPLSVGSSTAADDFYETPANQELKVRGPGLLANDTASPTSIVTFGGDGPHHGGLSWHVGMREGEFDYTPLPGYVGFDTFTYCLVSRQPSPCESAVATVIIRVGDPVVSRLAGADRFEGAAAVARSTNPVRSGFVFIASGENFPDALGAAPAAGKFGFALLLVTKAGVPDATRAELERLKPGEAIVVGGPAAVSESVLGELRDILPSGASVSRIGGRDRYEVSRVLAEQLYGEAPHSFTVTGANFADALSAGSAAGAAHEPVVLLDGRADVADGETQAAFLNLSTSSITIVGGTEAVSSGVESTLQTIATVDRLAGSDRYEAAVGVARKNVMTSATAVIATGTNYPDALVGANLAAQRGAPLYLSPGSCVPTAVLADLARVGASEIVLLGGERALSPEVAALKHC